MKYLITTADAAGNKVTIGYRSAKARDKVLYQKGGIAAFDKLGLVHPGIPVNEPQMVERINILTGKSFMEEKDTPYYLSPSSETYHCS